MGIISLENACHIHHFPSPDHVAPHSQFSWPPITSFTSYANLKITLQPKALASLTLQDRQPRPLLLTSAFHPLSAHKALANISTSLPNVLPFGAADKCGDGVGRVGNAVVVLSVQSMTRTFGIGLFVVCVVDWVGSPVGDCGGESIEVNGRFAGVARTVERGSLVNVKALCKGCPV
jgi:hypothetical protein